MDTPTEGTILDYVGSTFDTFDERPITDVDSLVFSWLAYWDLAEDATAARTAEGMPIVDVYRAQGFARMTSKGLDTVDARRLLAAMVASPRFGDIRIANYVQETSDEDEKQFSAMTYLLPEGGAYLAFRGTDGTLVGWKEDFNIAFESEVPSQRSALDYLAQVAGETEGPLWTGGHSKGGNLAVYAAVKADADVAARLQAAFSHDGPGFTEENLSSEAWQAAKDLIHKTLPKESVVGMLLERQEDYVVVSSTGSGFMQHDPFTWVIEGLEFKLEEGVGAGARYFDAGINEWVAGMTREEREEFFDTLFGMFEASGETSFSGIKDNWQTSVPAMYDYLRKLDPDQRDRMTDVVKALLKAML